MPTWTRDELRKIGAAEELELSSVRHDDTLGGPVTIWVVRVGDDLYVERGRAPRAPGSAPRRCATPATSRRGGVGKDVAFVSEAAEDINDQIDAAYRTKYRRHGGRYVDPMVASQARATTIKLLPRSARA